MVALISGYLPKAFLYAAVEGTQAPAKNFARCELVAAEAVRRAIEQIVKPTNNGTGEQMPMTN